MKNSGINISFGVKMVITIQGNVNDLRYVGLLAKCVRLDGSSFVDGDKIAEIPHM